LDDRFVDVFVEQTVSEFVRVHDGGKSIAELYVQGVHITDQRRALLKSIAERFGVILDDHDVFQIACKPDRAQASILAIAQCASLAMFDIASHFPIVEEEPIVAKVKRTLDQWEPSAFDMKHGVRISGHATGAEHRFDSVAHSRDSSRQTVAIKVLVPGYGPQVQADRYGFMALDIKGTPYDKWPRLAVVSKADVWPRSALDLVRRLSSDTLELNTGQDARVEREIGPRVNRLAMVA
jgi:hypothetical protein